MRYQRVGTRYPHVTAALPAGHTLRSMGNEAGLRRLSLSETHVVRLVAEGLSDEQISERLGITVVEVSVGLAEIFRKLGLRSRTELALLAPSGPVAASMEDDGNG
jgi:DNA-binding NarL/FixJ family response regulator